MKAVLRDYVETCILACFILGVSIFLLLRLCASHFAPAELTYADLLFDPARVHSVSVTLSETDRAAQLSAPGHKAKYLAEVVIDGEAYRQVAFSTRGNASLYDLIGDENYNYYPYKLNFSKFVKDQTYHGLETVDLISFYNDNSCLRDFLAYQMMSAAGVETPLSVYVELTINGEFQGLYLAVEEPDRAFLARNQNPADAALFKPETAYHDIAKRQSYTAAGRLEELGTILPDGSVSPYARGADLVYRGDSPEFYADIFTNASTKYSRQDEEYIINAIKALDQAMFEPATLEATALDPEDFWDLPSLAKYAAVQNFIVNYDSYIGTIAHNYYLKLADGKLTLLPWDYNYAYNSIFAQWIDANLAETITENSVFEPELYVPESERPLWAYLKRNPTFLSLYLQAYRDFFSDYLDCGKLDQQIDQTAQLIRSYVAISPAYRASLDEFDWAVEDLRTFLHARTESVRQQVREFSFADAN